MVLCQICPRWVPSGRHNGVAFSIKFSLSRLKQIMLSDRLKNYSVRYLLENYRDLYWCKIVLLAANNVMTAVVYSVLAAAKIL